MEIIEALEKAIQSKNLEEKVALKITGCHGFCEAEPNIIIHPENIFYQKLQPKDAQEILTKIIEQGEIIERLLYIDPQNKKTYPKEKEIPFYTKQKRIVLGDNALLDPTDITDYFALGGYSALGKVLSTMSPEQVIESVKKRDFAVEEELVSLLEINGNLRAKPKGK